MNASSGSIVQSKVIAPRFKTALAHTYMMRQNTKRATDEDWSSVEIEVSMFNGHEAAML